MNKHTLTFFTQGVEEGTLIEILDCLLAPLEGELESPWRIDTEPASARERDWHVERDRCWQACEVEFQQQERMNAALRERP